jgi:hypothetical protein
MMIRKKPYAFLTLLLIASFAAGAAQAFAAGDEDTSCRMTFSMQGWSVLYQTASGHGMVTCTNGARAKVRLKMKGGGLSAGKYRLYGKGDFTGVRSLSDVYGTYAATDAHAGVVKSANAQIMTKGNVSLALASKGEGIDLGVGFSGFTISPASSRK